MTETFAIKEEIILLNQLLKALAWCESGAQTNAAIDAGLVKVNGKKELRKRNKLSKDFIIEFDGKNISIQSEDKLKYIEFISSNGSTLAKFSPTTKTIKYPISSLPKGLFIVKAVGRDNTCTKKIIN